MVDELRVDEVVALPMAPTVPSQDEEPLAGQGSKHLTAWLVVTVSISQHLA
jgi:hypothetical protein